MIIKQNWKDIEPEVHPNHPESKRRTIKGNNILIHINEAPAPNTSEVEKPDKFVYCTPLRQEKK